MLTDKLTSVKVFIVNSLLHSSHRYKPVCTGNTSCVLAPVIYKKAKKGSLFAANNKLQPQSSTTVIIAVRNFQRFSDRSFVSAFELIFILKLE